MSYYLRYALHNTPVAQLEMMRLRAEVARLRALLMTSDVKENVPAPAPTPTPPPDLMHRMPRMG